MPKQYQVTEHDGRVKKALPDGRRVLVAVPGQWIDWELAEELGLVDVPTNEPEPASPASPSKPKPRKRAAKKSPAPKKEAPPAPEPKGDAPAGSDQPPKYINYPPKSSGK